MALGMIDVLTGLIGLLIALYYYLSSNHDFWQKTNVKGPKPIPILGNFADIALGRTFQALHLEKIYNEYKSEPYIGIFAFSSPILMVKDPELIKDILIKDFQYFPDRIPIEPDDSNPFSLSLATVKYDVWRPLRNKLSPVFTSGKLKDMFYLLIDCANRLDQYIEKIIMKEDIVEVRELTAKYTTDAIGMCAFGLNINAIEDENSEFREFGKILSSSDGADRLKKIFRQFSPKFAKLIAPLMGSNKKKGFIDIMKQNIQYRKETKTRRNDFFDLLIDLQENKDDSNKFEFTDNFLIGQVFVFFLAGFETSSTTISNALYELALNQDVQEKLRNEINAKLESEVEKLSYESIKNMEYLDKVIKETLRKYPPVSTLMRQSSNSYTFNGSKVTIPKGCRVFIPTWSIHRDPDIYPEPELFDPERFNEENINTRHPMNYLPFGDGPHNCIGARFANVQIKVAMITILQKFRVSVCNKTSIPYVIDPKALLLASKGGIYLKITKL